MFGVTSATACCCAPPVTNCPNKWNNCTEFLTISVPAVTITRTTRVKALAFNPSRSWLTRDEWGQCIISRSCNLAIGQVIRAEYRSLSFSGLIFQKMASNGSTCPPQVLGPCCQKYKLVTGPQQTGSVTAVYSLAEAHIVLDGVGGNPCQIAWKTSQATHTGPLYGSISGVQTLSTLCGSLAFSNVPDPNPTACRATLNIEVGMTAIDALTMTFPHTVISNDVCEDDCYYDQAGTTEVYNFGFYGRYQQAWLPEPIQAPIRCPTQLGLASLDTASMQIGNEVVDLRNLIVTDQCADPAHIPCIGGSSSTVLCGGNYCPCNQFVQTQNGFAIINP